MKFYKYQGAGNDFVVVDDRDGRYAAISAEQIAKLCDRHYGVGADGLLLLRNEKNFAFRMKYYNSDGSLASFCGNGARCICAFASHLGVVSDGTQFVFVADDGCHKAITSPQWVDVNMIDVDRIVKFDDGCFLNTGVPHFVKNIGEEAVSPISAVDILTDAPNLRFDKRFAPDGTNVNYLSVCSSDTIFVRTYERGVEDETYACGTGITACAIVAGLINGNRSFNVVAKGGKLTVSFDLNGVCATNVWLGGPAIKVFEGDDETNLMLF